MEVTTNLSHKLHQSLTGKGNKSDFLIWKDDKQHKQQRQTEEKEEYEKKEKKQLGKKQQSTTGLFLPN